ncbi:MAG: hypothetical protein OXN84_03530, partial [Albidovulum sp.]|nr:hypothetical protein [Albidovulum sp.]
DECIRILVRLDQSEIEYEGPKSFAQQALSDCVDTAISRISKLSGGSGSQENPHSKYSRRQGESTRIRENFSTNQIAISIEARTGPELVMAAAARLGIYLGQENFTRSEILAEMKNAGSIYKPTFNNNLGASLKSLVKSGRLNHIHDSTYALSPEEYSRLERLFGPE